MMWWTYERYRCSKYIGFIVVKRAFINIYYYYIPTNKVQGYDGNVFYGLKLMKVNGIQFLPPSLVGKTAASVLIYLVCSVSPTNRYCIDCDIRKWPWSTRRTTNIS